jgi:hypothetical protein
MCLAPRYPTHPVKPCQNYLLPKEFDAFCEYLESHFLIMHLVGPLVMTGPPLLKFSNVWRCAHLASRPISQRIQSKSV